MQTFGKTGRKLVKASTDLAQIDLNKGEHLHYSFTAIGSRPIFRLSSDQDILWSDQDFSGHPRSSYELQWPNVSAEVGRKDDVQLFSMSFANMSKCTLRIEQHDSMHNVLKVLKHIDYESEDPSDIMTESLRVLLLSGPHGPGEAPFEGEEPSTDPGGPHSGGEGPDERAVD